MPVVCGLFRCPRLTHHKPSLSLPRNPLEHSSQALCSGESTVCCLMGNFPVSSPGISHSGLCIPSSEKTGTFFGKDFFWGCDTVGQGFVMDYLWNSRQPARRQQHCTPKL